MKYFLLTFEPHDFEIKCKCGWTKKMHGDQIATQFAQVLIDSCKKCSPDSAGGAFGQLYRDADGEPVGKDCIKYNIFSKADRRVPKDVLEDAVNKNDFLFDRRGRYLGAKNKQGGKVKKIICPECGGDGKETCNNPDHGFIEALSPSYDNTDYRKSAFADVGRSGCPVCGHDPNYKVPNGGDCGLCDGVGHVEEHVAIKYCDETGYDLELVEI